MPLSDFTALYSKADCDYADILSGPYFYCGIDVPGFVCVAGLRGGKVSGYWRPMVSFGIEGLQDNWIRYIWEDYSQDIYYQDFLIDGKLSPISRFLLEKGYRAEPYYTQVIDLRKSEEELRHEVRKSYRSLINKQETVMPCTVPEFRAIHQAVKGITRPDATWQIQEQMDPVCVRTCDNSAGVMFYHTGKWAYYASAAGENCHAAIWRALLDLQKRGAWWCEMGEQVLSGPDVKLIGISHHKAGYGGETRVRLNLRKPMP